MPTYQPFDWYETPRYYDLIFDSDTPKETDFLEAVVRLYNPAAPKRLNIYEPACGSGRLVAALAQRGHRVLGTDLSPGMLHYAQNRLKHLKLNRRCELLEQNMTDHVDQSTLIDEGQFDLAHCFVSTFKYLQSDADAVAALRAVARALKPGGLFALGLHLTDYDHQRIQRERWTAEDPKPLLPNHPPVAVVCNIQSWPPDPNTRTEQLRSRLIVTRLDTDKVHHYESHWTFRTYDAAQLQNVLNQVPELEHLATYNFNYDLSQPQELGEDYLDNLLILQKT